MREEIELQEKQKSHIDLYTRISKRRNTIAPSKAATVETQNTVSVIRYKGAWAIRDVIGKQTSIDFPLDSGSEVTPEKK